MTPPHSWRDWFPWPLGTHWCWFETGMSIIVGVYVWSVAMLLLIDWMTRP